MKPTRPEVIRTIQHEPTKTYIVFDGNTRPQFVYQAPSSAKDGEPCLLTEYTYTGPVSVIILGTKETHVPWLDAYDVAAGFTT